MPTASQLQAVPPALLGVRSSHCGGWGGLDVGRMAAATVQPPLLCHAQEEQQPQRLETGRAPRRGWPPWRRTELEPISSGTKVLSQPHRDAFCLGLNWECQLHSEDMGRARPSPFLRHTLQKLVAGREQSPPASSHSPMVQHTLVPPPPSRSAGPAAPRAPGESQPRGSPVRGQERVGVCCSRARRW